MNKKPLFFYGWVILALSFVAMVLAHGARNSFSVFYLEILREFGWSRASTAGIFSVNLIAYGIAAPFAGALVDRFGPKRLFLIGGTILALATALCSRAQTIYHFYILFGLAGAIGSSLIAYPASAPVLARWFVRRRGMVFGIFDAGWGAALLVVPLVQYLITQFGWRTSFIWVGVMVAVILLPLAALFSRHKPEDMGLLPDGIDPAGMPKPAPNGTERIVKLNKNPINIDWTLRRAMGTFRFWLIFCAFFCVFGFVPYFVVVHQIALVRDAGFSSTFAASVVILMAIMIILGNISASVSDRIGREKTFSLGCFLLTLGLLMLLLLKKNSQSWMLYSYAVSLGLGLGITAPTLTAAVADMFQGNNFGSINGFMTLGFGLGGTVGPWFGGFVFDHTKSYSVALAVAILLTCTSAVMVWIAAPRKVKMMGKGGPQTLSISPGSL